MPASEYTPTADELGARMPARTLDADGNRAGTFTTTTTPTATQATALIADAVAIVSAAIGDDIPTGRWAAAKYAVICKAAMAAERGYYPEQTGDGSAYQAFSDEYDAAIQALTAGLQDNQPNHARVYSVTTTAPAAASDGDTILDGGTP